MQIITSKDNELIKEIKKLKEKKYRDQENKFIVEGIKMVKEAIAEKRKIDTIVICEDCEGIQVDGQETMYEIAKQNCIYVTKKVFSTITDVMAPQGILAVIKKEAEEESINYNEDIIVVLDGIQDPGNLGTIIRTVDSVGLTQLIVSKETVDAYNPKVVRSTMGAIYRVKVIEAVSLEETLKMIKKHKFEVMATSLEEAESIYDVEYKKKVIVIGNEANGVSSQILEMADKKIKIPMRGKTESLNASVATAVILYEYARRA